MKTYKIANFFNINLYLPANNDLQNPFCYAEFENITDTFYLNDSSFKSHSLDDNLVEEIVIDWVEDHKDQLIKQITNNDFSWIDGD